MNAFHQLAAYRNAGSEMAFSELVRRYTHLVYSMAKRRLTDGTLAEDATQTVFSRLAQTPPNVRSEADLVAWLHRTTTRVSIDLWRSETRRRTREQQAAFMQSASASDTPSWTELSPHLDQALDELNDADRQAVLLRFFERKPMRELGQILGVSEDAAKMRVSRAIDRLRHRLSLRGIICTSLALTAVLTQRAVEAAPAHLLSRLSAIQLSGPAAAGVGGLTSLIMHGVKSKAAITSVAILVVTVLIATFARSPGRNAPPTASPSDSISAPSAEGGSGQPGTRPDPSSENAATAPSNNTRFALRVKDRQTGMGLAGVNVRAAYFYAGGVGEGHELQTDAGGKADLPYPNSPERNAGLNVFVSLTGYVPKSIRFGELTGPAEDYLLELDPALTVGGTVVDKTGWPVAGVTLEALRSEEYQADAPNTDFQRTTVTTDADGRWLFPYVPKEYATVDFYLSHSNYAVTRVSIPVGGSESLNATLLIERGFTLVGRVTDAEGWPVAGALVQERHEYGFPERSTQADEEGYYALTGLAIPTISFVNFSNPLKPTKARPDPEHKTELIVQAPGMTPQLRQIQLQEPTHTVDFVLAPGRIFRGRVVDEAGNPIPGAVVRTDSHFDPYIPTRFQWLTHTDLTGYFEWDSAPAEEACFWFEADGYEVIRGRPLLADGTDHEIRMTRKAGQPPSGPSAQRDDR